MGTSSSRKRQKARGDLVGVARIELSPEGADEVLAQLNNPSPIPEKLIRRARRRRGIIRNYDLFAETPEKG